MEVEMEVEGQDEEAEREMAPKKLRIRGEAQVPDERREPTSQDAKALIIPNEKDNWTYDKGVRQPSSMIGALIRQYWPGFYTPVPGGEKKLAETWADYEAAPCPGFGTASDAVYTKFWVKHASRVYFIVDDHTMLTHVSLTIILMHDCGPIIRCPMIWLS
nr:uncharacterized protein LOC127330133 [Lolium perenne]